MSRTFYRLLSLFFMAMGYAGAAPARADLILGFAIDNSRDMVRADPGDMVIIEIFAIQTGSSMNLSSSGLSGMGTGGTFTTGFGSIASISVGESFADFPLAAFDNSLGTFELQGSATDFKDVLGSSIRLGQIVFNVTGEGITRFTFGDPNPSTSFANFAAGSADGFADLDDAFYGPSRGKTYTFTIDSVAVPEAYPIPALIVAALLLYSSRRRIRIEFPTNQLV